MPCLNSLTAAVLASLVLTTACVQAESPPVLAGEFSSPPAVQASPQKPGSTAAPQPAWQVVESYGHDRRIFTQGLELHGNRLYESSGLYNQSFIQHVPWPAPDRAIGPLGQTHPSLVVTGGVQANRFAEGLTILNDELFLLTWRSGEVFLFHPETLQPQGKLRVSGEGWGLTNDGKSLIMSNGSAELRWLNPRNLKVRKRLEVTDNNGQPQANLNELEFINGEIFANIWQQDRIVRIDPDTGKILQTLDLTTLWPRAERPGRADVLNGIAWEPLSQSLLITGKRWPTMYRVKLRDAPGSLLAATKPNVTNNTAAPQALTKPVN